MNYEPLVERVLGTLARYHDHQVLGLDNIPKSGPALIVGNHSLATYDTGLLWLAIRREHGRTPRLLADRALFKIPVVRDIVRSYGSLEGSPESARKLLADGELLVVNPGGMREALRPSGRRYQIDMDDRKGFARLAIQAQVPVILSACPAADDLYHVVDNPLTPLIYKSAKLPAPLAFGRAGTPLPKPAKLTHALSSPIDPPAYDGGNIDQDMLDNFHKRLVTQLSEMMRKFGQGVGHAGAALDAAA